MDIIVIYGSYPRDIAGSQRMAERTAAELARRGHQVTALREEPGVSMAAHARRLIADRPGWRPDVVHAFDLARPEPIRTAIELATQLDAPLALTPCSDAGVWPDPGLGRHACATAGVVFALTGAEEARIRELGAGGDVVRRVPAAADPAPATDPSGFRLRHALADDVVLFVGRRSAAKGYPVLLAAAELVWRAAPGTSFVLIGPDAGTAAIPGTPAASTLADRRLVDLGVAGEQAKHDAIAACTLLCLPTSYDVFPLVFLEAWSHAKPVVTGAFAGVAGVVRHGVDGLVVPAEPRAVAAAVLDLLRRPHWAAALGRSGQARTNTQFGWSQVARCYEAGYRFALQARR